MDLTTEIKGRPDVRSTAASVFFWIDQTSGQVRKMWCLTARVWRTHNEENTEIYTPSQYIMEIHWSNWAEYSMARRPSRYLAPKCLRCTTTLQSTWRVLTSTLRWDAWCDLFGATCATCFACTKSPVPRTPQFPPSHEFSGPLESLWSALVIWSSHFFRKSAGNGPGHTSQIWVYRAWRRPGGLDIAMVGWWHGTTLGAAVVYHPIPGCPWHAQQSGAAAEGLGEVAGNEGIWTWTSWSVSSWWSWCWY